jgi:tRNA-dihydrouridine synthase A
MMAWTDRHCRYLHRLLAPSALLFTEMVTSNALQHGPTARLLAHQTAEYPLALQLGGSDPIELARSALLGANAGVSEINLNVGCPSPRVRKGAFGACLMLEPARVADCVAAMQDAVDIPVTVKCRLGVDAADSDELLLAFAQAVSSAGCQRLYVHARKAILGGLSPAQNRQIPPLQYERVYRLATHLDIPVIINGGITDAATALAQLEHTDGVMLGRAAYHNPLLLMQLSRDLGLDRNLDSNLDPILDKESAANTDQQRVLQAYAQYQAYAAEQLRGDVHLQSLVKPLLGLFTGMRGARQFRRTLSDTQLLRRNDAGLLSQALDSLLLQAA